MLYLYLSIATLVFLFSEGPRTPRVALAALWLPLCAAMLLVTCVALLSRQFEEEISFDRWRRFWRWRKKVRGLLGAGVASILVLGCESTTAKPCVPHLPDERMAPEQQCWRGAKLAVFDGVAVCVCPPGVEL
jgi:hypothetical protein